MWAHFRAGILSVGAFALGVAFEKNCRLQADVVETRSNGAVVIDNAGDVLDVADVELPPSSRDAVSLIAKHGLPSMQGLRSYPNFIVSYDLRLRIAHWVLERITAEELTTATKYNRSGVEFFEDKSFHAFFRASNHDYKGSGYDRGHLAAAGNYRANAEAIKQTYVLSNIAPQVGRGFNRDKWNDLEKYCRAKVRQLGEAWICTGPLFLPTREPTNGRLYVKHEVIGASQVAVPTHFFKAILYPDDSTASGTYRLECFLMPNAPIDNAKSITDFRVDPQVVERAAGLLLFNAIPQKHIRVIK